MRIVNFESGQCKRVRSYLDSYLNNELMVETNLEVLKHLEGCDACTRALDDRARIKAQLKRGVLEVQAPDALTDRIRSEIRRPHGLNFNFTRPWMLAAAAMFVLAVMLAVLFRAGTNPSTSQQGPLSLVAGADAGDAARQILKIGFDDHVHCAIDHDMANRRFTRLEMSEQLGPQYEGLVELLKDKMPQEFEVAVGHRCHYQNREFVHLIMRRQEEVVSLILTQKNGEAFPSGGAADLKNELYEASWHNLQVAGFETDNYLAFVISNETQKENGQLASRVMPAVEDFLKRPTV